MSFNPRNFFLKSFRRRMLKNADNARDRKDYTRAAILYHSIVVKWGWSKNIVMQMGNALKDSGQFDEAASAYSEVWNSELRDSDVALQLGHLYKLKGELQSAVEWYARSIEIDDGNTDNPARKEFDRLCVHTKESGASDGPTATVVAKVFEIYDMGFFEETRRRRFVQEIQFRPH